jgi:hypothetical protein
MRLISDCFSGGPAGRARARGSRVRLLRLTIQSLVIIALLTGCQGSDSNGFGPKLAPKPAQSPQTGKATRTIHFSGYEWNVKAAAGGPVGPGPNYFSDAPDSVWVDGAGRLHLRIRFASGRWSAAELISKRSFGYGTYRFHLDTNVDELDPNVVVGFFTWSDDPAFAHREIDIELGRWGQEHHDLGQCVLQPYYLPGHHIRFPLPRGTQSSIHSFTWTPTRVFCRILGKPHSPPSPTHSVIYEHSFNAGVPVAGGENARINLWLLGSQAPRNGQEVEIIVSRFEFHPP